MIVFAALVMAILTIPYVLGWLVQGDEWVFSGFLFGTDDGFSYLAKMRLGAQGHWLFTVRYTSEPHEGALLFLPYILLGRLTTLFVDPQSTNLTTALAIMYHAARVVFGFLMILISYCFVAVFLRRVSSRMLALVLITVGGGLGWLLSLIGLGQWFGSLPVDFIVPEGYSFLILFGLPHLALSRGVLLLGFLLLFRSLQTTESWLRWSLLAGLCWMVMGLCVPFYIAVLYLVLGFWGLAVWIRTRLFPWDLFWRAVVAGLIVLPVLIYTGLVFITSDVFSRWSSQNLLPSPHPLHYVAGYIVLAIPATAALRWAWRKGGNAQPYLLLASWIVIVPVMIYLPINVQRRLAEGVIIPLSILAVVGLRLLFQRRRLVQKILLALVLPTALLLWLGGLFSVLNPARPLFRPRAEWEAMERLNEIAPRDSVVLSVKETGNVLPAKTDLIAYVGHGPETLDGAKKRRLSERFFAGELSADEQRGLLEEVDFVFYGPLERGDSPVESWAAGLRLLVPVDDVYKVYEVPRDD